MGNISNLKRQHLEIQQVVNQIEDLIKQNNLEDKAAQIAQNISILAGKLRIHLDTEDKFLYPDLLKDDRNNLRKMAKEYSEEMGHISEVFMNYKNNFNTKSKIIKNMEGFKSETALVFKVLAKRISKEDNELYPLIDK